MKCINVKEWLDQNFTAAGVILTGEIERHLADCSDCKAYYSDLAAIQDQLREIEDITLTAVEEQALMQGLETSLESMTTAKTVGGLRRWSTLIARPVTAIAAVLVVALGSWQYQSQTIDVQPIVEQMELSNISGEEALEIYLDDELDNLSALIDQSSVLYLTDEIPHRQAEEILDYVSEEEIESIASDEYGIALMTMES